jgi:hypothetical protein
MKGLNSWFRQINGMFQETGAGKIKLYKTGVQKHDYGQWLR